MQDSEEGFFIFVFNPFLLVVNQVLQKVNPPDILVTCISLTVSLIWRQMVTVALSAFINNVWWLLERSAVGREVGWYGRAREPV